MSLHDVERWLAAIFSGNKIASDFYAYLENTGSLSEGKCRCVVDGVEFQFHATTQLEVVSRTAQFDIRPIAIEVRILIAVGGVVREANGISEAMFFFAKIYYSDENFPIRVEMDSSQFAL